jgi:hypothetical protein
MVPFCSGIFDIDYVFEILKPEQNEKINSILHFKKNEAIKNILIKYSIARLERTWGNSGWFTHSSPYGNGQYRYYRPYRRFRRPSFRYNYHGRCNCVDILDTFEACFADDCGQHTACYLKLLDFP